MHKIFVYGTLMTGRGTETFVSGELYNLGAFPGIVKVGEVPNLVPGEILEVDDVQLKAFDHYEGVDSGLYRRIRAKAMSGDEVWIYEFAQDLPTHANKIERWFRR